MKKITYSNNLHIATYLLIAFQVIYKEVVIFVIWLCRYLKDLNIFISNKLTKEGVDHKLDANTTHYNKRSGKLFAVFRSSLDGLGCANPLSYKINHFILCRGIKPRVLERPCDYGLSAN